MVKRIVCCVVVSLLLMLWPAAPASAGEGEGQQQMIALVEDYYVCPDRVEDFTKYMKEATEAATAHGYPYSWNVYALDDMRYVGIMWVDGLAGIEEMSTAWADVIEKWSAETDNNWFEKTFATMSHWDSSIWKPRPDLSYVPADEDAELNYVVWAKASIKLGHQDKVEALFQEYLKTFAEREFPYGWTAAELMIGTGFPTLIFVDWAASPGAYWTRHDKEQKDEVMGPKSAEIWHKMLPHLRGFEYFSGHYLKELSYHPKKVEEE